MDDFGLWPLSKGYSQGYMNTFDPRITTEFATAAFRFGHSLIPDSFDRISNNVRTSRLTSRYARPLLSKQFQHSVFHSSMNLREVFFKPSEMKKNAGMLDDLVRGLTSQEGELWDNSFSSDIQDHLFENGNSKGGLDLVALNIQRGRDHGIPGTVLISLFPITSERVIRCFLFWQIGGEGENIERGKADAYID